MAEWYYGIIEEVCCVDSVRSYKIRFDDGTSESNVLNDYIQFIARPDDSKVIDVVDVTTDVVDDVISLLDPLGENNIVEDVEIQEMWES